MSDSNLEGLDRRLRDSHDEIETNSEKGRRDTAVVDIPDELEQVLTPPRALINLLAGDQVGLCGGRFQLTWQSGEWKGLPVTGYCVEPLCINEGECTGTRFVPHTEQWTSTDPELRKHRNMDPREVVAAARTFAGKAAAQTGRHEDRTDREILQFVKTVWLRTVASIRGQGGWTR